MAADNLSRLIGRLEEHLAERGQTLSARSADLCARIGRVVPRPALTGGALLAGAPPSEPPELAFRFLGAVSHQGDMIAHAARAGLIEPESDAVAFHREVMRTLGAHVMITGLDVRPFRAVHPVKGWVFFDRTIPTSHLLALDALPSAARDHLRVFDRLGYPGASALAVDPAGTMNVYFFGRRPYLASPMALAEACRALGVTPRGEDLDHLSTHAVGVYPTFAFHPDARGVERFCVTRMITPTELARRAHALRGYCAFSDRLGGPILSMVMGCTFGRRAEDYRVKAELHPPGLGGPAQMRRGFATSLSLPTQLGVARTMLLGDPVGALRTLVAGLPGGGPLVRRLPHRHP